MSLLEQSALFFPTASSLPDRAEGGFYTAKRLRLIQMVTTVMISKGDKSAQLFADASETLHLEQEFRKQFICVLSWYRDACESYAMWKAYVPNEGICITTSQLRLRKALQNTKAIIKEVVYEEHSGGLEHYIDPFFKKLPQYKYESEVRAVINLYNEKYKTEDLEHSKEPELRSLLLNNGVLIPVDLGELVSSIVISPLAKPWFKKTVSQIVRRYNLKAPVIDSELHNEIKI